MTATVGILVPLMRPSKLAPLLDNITETTTGYRVHIIARGAALSDAYRVVRGRNRTALWADHTRDGTWPQRINYLARVTSEPYVFLGADDLRFHAGWLETAMWHMLTTDGVVVVNDLHNPRGTNALVSRRYIDELGTVGEPGKVIHDGYSHCYSDNECWETARSRQRYAYAGESVVEHLHPDAGKAEHDAVYAKGLSTLDADRELYESRRHLWEAHA